MARIRIGTASWTDHDPFYPPEYNRTDMRSRRIEYYARYFDVVEVDSTFYHLQPARNFAMWAERTPDDFVFDVKAYSEVLTWHHRDEQGEAMTPHADTFANFSAMVEPCASAQAGARSSSSSRPGSPLARSGWSLLLLCARRCPTIPSRSKFRHRSWLEGPRVKADPRGADRPTVGVLRGG